MARIRSLKPEHTFSEKVGILSDRSYRLWIALICNADDDGRGILRFEELRVKVYGYQPRVTAPQVESGVLEIARAHLIAIYQNSGKTYYQLHDWTDHQKIQHPTPSRLPSPEDSGSLMSPHENNRDLTNPHPDLSYPIQGSRIKDQGSNISDEPQTVAPTVTLHRERKARKSAQTGKKETPLAIKTFREVTGHYPPAVLYQEVVEQIGERTAETLLPFYQEWCSRGYNTRGTKWLVWVLSGAIPERYGKQPVAAATEGRPLPNGSPAASDPSQRDDFWEKVQTHKEQADAQKREQEARKAEQREKEEERFDQEAKAWMDAQDQAKAEKEKHHES